MFFAEKKGAILPSEGSPFELSFGDLMPSPTTPFADEHRKTATASCALRRESQFEGVGERVALSRSWIVDQVLRVDLEVSELTPVDRELQAPF